MRPGQPSNPFSVQRLGPDGASYVFPEGENAASVADDLSAHGWRGELVGPHGVGKSTLLLTLCQEARRRGVETQVWRLSREHRFPPLAAVIWSLRAGMIAVDGAEVLPRPLLTVLRAFTRLKGQGLLVTTHAPLGLGWSRPVRTLPVVFARFAADTAGDRKWLVPAGQALESHDGNAREALFTLYMEYEGGSK